MVYDGFIIDSSNAVFIRTVSREIRGYHQPEIYLKGIFLMGNPKIKDKAVYYDMNVSEGEADLTLQSMETFMSLLKYDIIREGRELGDDVLTGIYFENLNDFALQFGDFRRQSLIREIAVIVQQRMNDLDYMCLEQSNILWVVIHDVKNVEKAIENLVKEIKELIERNLSSVKLTILFEYNHLQAVASAEMCMLDIKRKMLVE